MQSITAKQLSDMMQKQEKFLLVNTLSREHFDQTRIEGAVNIPEQQDDFVDKVADKADDKDQTVVVYCASSSCDSSEKAAEKLEAAGFTHMVDFADGAEGWKKFKA